MLLRSCAMRSGVVTPASAPASMSWTGSPGSACMMAKTTEKTRTTTGISTATRCPMYMATYVTPRAAPALFFHRNIVEEVPRASRAKPEATDFLHHRVILWIVEGRQVQGLFRHNLLGLREERLPPHLIGGGLGLKKDLVEHGILVPCPRPASRPVVLRVELVEENIRLIASQPFVYDIKVAVERTLQLHRSRDDFHPQLDADSPKLRRQVLADLFVMQHDDRERKRLAVLLPYTGAGIVLPPRFVEQAAGPAWIESVGAVRSLPIIERVFGERSLHRNVAAAVQGLVHSILIVGVPESPPHPDVVKWRAPGIHREHHAVAGLVASDERIRRVARVGRDGLRRQPGDEIGLARLQDLSEHPLISHESNGDAVQVGGSLMLLPGSPAMVGWIPDEAHVVTAYPSVELESAFADEMLLETAPELADGCRRPQRKDTEPVEQGGNR